MNHRKSYRYYLGFNDIGFMLVGIPVLSVLVTMIFTGLGFAESIFCFGKSPLMSIFFTGAFWIGDRTIIIWFRKIFLHPDETARRLYWQSVVILAYTAVMSLFLFWSKDYFQNNLPSGAVQPGYLKSFVTCLFATGLVAAIYEAAYFINRWKLSIAEQERLQLQQTQSQLASLRNQINPHFLFNSLNTLASLIPEEPHAALDFVHKLSNVYRSVLELKDRPMVKLSEELEYLDNYIFLLKKRFGDNVHFEVRLSDACEDCYMVPLSLQMLVENCIKHNIVASKKPLRIEIFNESPESLIIRNNLQVKSIEEPGTGIGLKNIEERYRLTFQKSIETQQTAEFFLVKLPLIKIATYESAGN